MRLTLSLHRTGKKIPVISSILLLFFSIVIAGTSLTAYEIKNNRDDIDNYYLHRLLELKLKIRELQSNSDRNISIVDKKNSRNNLKTSFHEARILYKKIAVFIDYYNGYEARLLNGPALQRVEEDNPQHIIEPHGFQVLEEILFDKKGKTRLDDAKKETEHILSVINRLENEPDRQYKFTNATVWDALRSAVFRLATLGITGFDSPIALHSLPEAVATLESVKEIVSLYKKEFSSSRYQSYDQLVAMLDKAITYLKINNDFNSVDRLFFTRDYISPIYAEIINNRLSLGYFLPDERRPVNVNNSHLFSDSLFDINFFSPNERFRVSPERVELGKKLFYDPRLSGTGKRSCATCHIPEKAFTDGLSTALSVDGKTFLLRNTPTLWNSALQTRQFFDSRTSKLENQLSDVLHNENEMKGSLKKAVGELQSDPIYTSLFRKAYKNENEPVAEYTIANAISSYVRSLVALNSRFDQYLQGDESRMSTMEKRGFNLFMGKAKCATCHFMPLFNGLVPPDYNETESEVLGVPKTNKKRVTIDPDLGKYNYTRSVIHRFAFKTPTLRNIALTAPYMHNGVFATLEEVMDFYNKGGGSGLGIAPENQTLPAEKLQLTKTEIQAVIAFMKTLTDTVVVHTD